MASPTGSTRARALGVALAACALALAALVAILSRRDDSRPQSASASANPESSSAVEPRVQGVSETTAELPRVAREVVEPAAPQAPLAAPGPFLLGRVTDERGEALQGVTPRVRVSGPLDQRLAAPVDERGGFGPLRLLPGVWSVVAEADGHRSVRREVEFTAGVSPEALELVLQRITHLDVLLVADGPGRRGDAARDLAGLADLLSLQVAFAGEEAVERRALELPWGNVNRGPHLLARFEPPAGRAGTLELLLGSERVLQCPVAADEEQLVLHVDPLQLYARMIELEVELRDTRGRPLERIGGVLLTWGDSTYLVAGQPGPEPWRARFAECPPGPARLIVVDVDGRRAEAELQVPFEGPARLELSLELAEPP